MRDASGKTQGPYSDYSTETMEDRRQWKDDFEVLKENYYSKILYTANISFKNEDEIKAAEKNLENFPPAAPQLISYRRQITLPGSQEIGQNWARVKAKVWALGC